MRRSVLVWAVAVGMAVACAATETRPGAAQTATPIPTQAAPQPAAPEATQSPAAIAGGRLHGVVKSGTTPLPGVTVTAQNTLTGKRFSTTTDIAGAWSLTLTQNGRYVIRTQFAAFAQGAQEAVLNATSREQAVNFDLLLASRAAKQQAAEAASQAGSPAALLQGGLQAIQQLAGSGAQSLNLQSALDSGAESQNGAAGAQAGAALPSAASNTDFSTDSVAVSGQSGTVSPLAGVDMDRLRDAVETLRSQGVDLGGAGGNFGGGGGLFGGGGFGGGGSGGPGGFGGGGGRGNFRGFNPGQPHGAVFWIGSNSALNAEPFSLNGQPQAQPPSGSNRFGLTFMSSPYLPGLTKPSGKDIIFLTLSGSRTSNPMDEYATVPTDGTNGTYNQRAGDLRGLPAIYIPNTNQQFSSNNQLNVIPGGLIATPATNLLTCSQPNCQPFIPLPNLATTSNGYNYHLLTTAQSNSTQAGVRYMRNLGKNATLPGGFGGRGGGGGRRSQNQGLRQSISLNYNWSDSASDNVNLVPQLGGKTASGSNSAQAGYTVGYKKLTSIFNANWNRSNSHTTNYFTNGTDIATQVGVMGPGSTPLNPNPLNSNPIDYGLPNIVLSAFTGISQVQPSFSISQTISLSETLSWIHKKHNLRFGGDYRRVHRDFLGGSNATGTFTFSGKFTQDQAGDATTGSALADFLLGYPQETTLDVAATKSYLRDNVFDLYAQDDWRATPKLTLNFGLRYEFFAPYTEKYGHLAMVDTNPASGFSSEKEVQAGGVGASSGPLPQGLVYPERTAFAPRFGLAFRAPKQTVLRAGYGMNYTVGQYGAFANTMARQPMTSAQANGQPFVNEQSNEATTAGQLTLGSGFPAPDLTGSYALDPHYRLPYVQAWNVDVQKALPWGVVLNAGYNGSKGQDLDIRSAPRAAAGSLGTDPTNLVFNYEQSGAFSRFNAGTLRVNKRLTHGLSMGANYQYSHSIDDASSVGGNSTVVVQDWQHLLAEESNSSFDQRHKVSGNYLYELPFGKDKIWLTSGAGAHILEGFSISGSFTFATGLPLTPNYQAASSDVAHGTAGTLRPNRDYTQSLTAGGGSAAHWFNTAVFYLPKPDANGNAFGNASRNSIPAPGTVSNNMSLSKTMQLGGTSSMEMRATANNVFNTVQYAGVGTSLGMPTFGKVTSAAAMRSFQFTARFRF